jgi:hypothetical protein
MRGEGEADIIAMADAGVGDAIRIGNKVCGAPKGRSSPLLWIDCHRKVPPKNRPRNGEHSTA